MRKFVDPEPSSDKSMNIFEGLLKHVKKGRHFPEFRSLKNRRTIIEDSLASFWDNEYDEAWNEC